jgi:hypothetical protein
MDFVVGVECAAGTVDAAAQTQFCLQVPRPAAAAVDRKLDGEHDAA